MIVVTPIKKAEEQENLCAICKIKYDKSKFAYAAYENGDVRGVLQFTVEDKTGYITELGYTDKPSYEILNLLGRAATSFLEQHEIKIVYFEPRGKEVEKIAELIGFKKSKNEIFIEY